MTWSFSQYKSFRQCQRQWFYRSKFAKSKANDPLRKEAARLSKLNNLKAWRGKIVDVVISNNIIPAVKQGKTVNLGMATEIALKFFQEQQLQGMHPIPARDVDFSGFVEVEYGKPPTPEDFDFAWKEIQQALDSFFKNSFIWENLKIANTVNTQRNIQFSCNSFNVKAVPDVLYFFLDQPPLIIDWKVQTNPIADYWMQLAIYAIALTRCKPHRDWPALSSKLHPSDVKLAEIQLLTDTIRMHTVTDEEIENLEEIIVDSATEMSLAMGSGIIKDIQAKEFPTARYPNTCMYCNFKKLCWVKT